MTLPLPDDFTQPDVPRTQGEFYRLYVFNIGHINRKLESIDKNYSEDREDYLALFDGIKDSLAKHSSCMDSLDLRLKQVEKTTESNSVKYDNLAIKNNWFAGINALLTTVMGIVLSIIKGNS